MVNLFQSFHQFLPNPIKPRVMGIPGFCFIRQWLNGVNVDNAMLASFICRIIPAQCPFERKIDLFGDISIQIPPLCKLNPFYAETVGLRFRALCYLADECNQDIRSYC
jgi:hypothetical protein